jgi:hypothetical protein
MNPVTCPKCGKNLTHTRALSGGIGLVSGSSCIHCGTWIDDDIDVVMPELPPDGPDDIIKTRGKQPRTTNTAVITSDTHTISLIDVYRAKQSADMELFLSGLDALHSPMDKLKYAMEIILK